MDQPCLASRPVCPPPASFSRFASVDLTGVTVSLATTEADFGAVERLRSSGFSRVLRGATTQRPTWVDAGDRAPGIHTLLGFDAQGEPIATLRVQDSRCGPLELSHLVRLEPLLGAIELPAAQFSRLTALKRPGSANVMFGLFKAAWFWCLAEGLRSIVIATPRWSRPIYDFMLFEDLGPEGRFAHPVLAGVEHACMKLPVQGAERLWRAGGQPLCEQFFDTEHAALRFTPRS